VRGVVVEIPMVESGRGGGIESRNRGQNQHVSCMKDDYCERRVTAKRGTKQQTTSRRRGEANDVAGAGKEGRNEKQPG
jgi:hypothetical protein